MVNGKAMKSTSVEPESFGIKSIFNDGSKKIHNISKPLLGSQLFKLQWKDISMNCSISSDKESIVVVVVWELELRTDDLIDLLQLEGWILKNGLDFWWTDYKFSMHKHKYGKAKTMLSKSLQVGQTLSFNKPENHMPISILVIEGKIKII